MLTKIRYTKLKKKSFSEIPGTLRHLNKIPRARSHYKPFTTNFKITPEVLESMNPDKNVWY